MFETIKSWFTKATPQQFSAILENRFNSLIGRSSNTQLLKSYRGWVFACVQAIAQDVSDIDLKLMRRSGDEEPEEVNDHEVLEILNRVNPRMTMHDLFEITQAHLELEGNSFWFLARDNEGEGQVREIWPLRPDRVNFKEDSENPLLVAKYIYERNGKKIEFDADEVIHFANFNAEADYPFPSRGIGTVEASALSIDTNNFAREWNKNFFLNSARPDVLLKTEANLKPEEYERIKRKFEAAHQGTGKAHRFMLLQGGMEMDKLSENQKDMDFVSQVMQTRDEILAMFRVPKTVLGLTDDVNRANAEATNFVFALRTIKPKMQKVVDTLNEFLLPLFDESGDLFFDFTSPVPENREQTVLEYEKGVNNWLSRNEIRAREGLPPTQNGDAFFGQFASVRQDEVIKMAKPKKKPEAVSGKDRKEHTTLEEAVEQTTKEHINAIFKKQNGKKKKKKKEDKPEPKRNLSYAQVKHFWELCMKQIENREVEFNRKMLLYLEGQKKRVLDSVENELKGLEPKEFSFKQADNLLPSVEDEISLLIDLMTPEYREFLQESGEQAVDSLGLGVIFDPNNPRAIEFLQQRSQFFAESVNDTTFQLLEKTLEEGLEEGEDIEKLSERVVELYEKRNPERIARTEVSSVSNFGNQEAYRQANVQKKQWVAFDSAEDTDCIANAQQDPVGINASFGSGDEAPPAHPNCVCIIIPIFE